jgi:hypothetical protein
MVRREVVTGRMVARKPARNGQVGAVGVYRIVGGGVRADGVRSG